MFWVAFNLSSANAFDSCKSEILSSGKGCNSLPNNKVLDWSKLKGFADNKLRYLKWWNWALIVEK